MRILLTHLLRKNPQKYPKISIVVWSTANLAFDYLELSFKTTYWPLLQTFVSRVINISALAVLSLLSTQPLFAETPAPNAGTLQQQFRRDLPQLPAEAATPSPAPAGTIPVEGATMVVESFIFRGATLLSKAQLEAAVAPFLNRPLDFNGLQQAAAAVGEAYRTAGWLARVYLPEQEVEGNRIILQIIEGSFGKLRQQSEGLSRIDAALPAGYITVVQEPGSLVNTVRLDRALLLLDDLPGVSATGNLVPGEAESETDLVLQLSDEPLFNGQLNLDNQGSRSTGAERFNGQFNFNSPLKQGDQFQGYFSHSEGNDFASLRYSLPFGYSGLRVGINGSYLEYDVIGSEFRAADLAGKSVTWGLDANYPLVRERTRNLYLGAAYENKDYRNDSSVGIQSDYKIDNFTVRLTGNLFDRIGGGGSNFVNLSLTRGELDLAALDLAENLRLSRQFSKFNYLISRQQAVSQSISLYVRLSGQWANENLDSAERFYLGGPSGIRAYPLNEGGGDQGQLVNLELRYRARPNLVLTGFYDWGRIEQNKDNNRILANPNRYELDGAGLSLAWSGPGGLELNATYARRLDDNPNPQANGNDQDGSLDKDRFWLSARLNF